VGYVARGSDADVGTNERVLGDWIAGVGLIAD
jgi:hypothetical protein